MTKEEVIQRTNDVFIDSFEIEPDELKPDANVFSDLGLDSLDTVDLVVALQKKFSVRIRDDERVRSIRTLGDVYDFILSVSEEMEAGGTGADVAAS